jgi:hypothetical protein
MFVFLKMTELIWRRPLSTILGTILMGVLAGIFMPTTFILGVGVVAGIIFVVPLFLFLATMSSPDSGLGPLIFLGPMIFALLFLVALGSAYYLATGQTGVQDLFASLRTLTN